MGSDPGDLRTDAADLTLEVVALTHRGRVRERNEDTVALPGWMSPEAMAEPRAGESRASEPDGPYPRAVTLDCRVPRLLLVADGMGGHAAGDVASRFVATRLGELLDGVEPAEEVLLEAIRGVNRQLYERMASDPPLAGMGTTLVGLWLSAADSFVFNVGDSRCYVVRDQELTALSRDDTPEARRGEPAGGRSGRRSGMVTQALGGGAMFHEIDPHVRRIEPVPGERYLLCSDGLTDMVPPSELARAFGGGSRDLTATATDLLERAQAAGGMDNISILLARFG